MTLTIIAALGAAGLLTIARLRPTKNERPVTIPVEKDK